MLSVWPASRTLLGSSGLDPTTSEPTLEAVTLPVNGMVGIRFHVWARTHRHLPYIYMLSEYGSRWERADMSDLDQTSERPPNVELASRVVGGDSRKVGSRSSKSVTLSFSVTSP